MKKALTILLVALLAITSVFAARSKGTEYAVGLQSGYAQDVQINESTDNWTRSIVPIKADAMIYLGDSVAINAAVGTNLYLTDNDDAKAGLVADILAYYNLKVGDNMNLLVGGGASYRYRSYSVDLISVGTSTTSCNQLALLGSVRFEFEATDNITAFAGVDVGYNVLNSINTKTNVLESTTNTGSNIEKANILPWAIKAGASYKF